MKPKVCILATCRNPELIRATTLVFDTLRIGFPTADVEVYLNKLSGRDAAVVTAASKAVAHTKKLFHTTHHEWVRQMIEFSDRPFWICDTDMVFFGKVEDWAFREALAGQWMPEFYDRYSKAWTRERLHTALMWIDPALARAKIAAYFDALTPTLFNEHREEQDLIAPHYFPERSRFGGNAVDWMDDTCGLLYHAIGGQAFTDEQLDSYAHLHCGTYVDLAGPALSDGGMQARHEEIYKNPELARGLWRQQQKYLMAHGK